MKTLHTKWNTSCSNCDVFIPRGAQVLWIEKGKVECSDCGADTLGRNLTPIVAPIAAPIAAPAAAPSDWMAALAWNPIDGTLPKVDAPKPAPISPKIVGMSDTARARHIANDAAAFNAAQLARNVAAQAPHPIPQALQDNLNAHLNNVAPMLTPSGNYKLADLKTALNQTGTVAPFDAGRAKLAAKNNGATSTTAPRPMLDSEMRIIGDLLVTITSALTQASNAQRKTLRDYIAWSADLAGSDSDRGTIWNSLRNLGA